MAADFQNPTFISENQKAKWGLDILFKQSLNSSITPLLECSNARVQVVKLALEIPIIVVNVYLPSSSLPESEYDESLSLLSTIITNYTMDGAILLSGDWNSSLHRNTTRDIKFKTFCRKNGIFPASFTNSSPSYHGYNGSVSKKDYVLAHEDSCSINGIKINEVKIISQICKEENPYIISTHDAIYFEVKYYFNEETVQSNNTPECESVELAHKRVDWENADIPKYQETLDSLLRQNFEIWSSPQNLQVLASVIPSSFIQAAELSAPARSNKKANFKIFKSENWLMAERTAKLASGKWVKAGKPRMDENALFKAKKESNVKLRAAIKVHNIQTCTDENNTMMSANFRDPKLFSKLVNKKKVNNSGYTTMLKYDDIEYRGDAQVLAGFFHYHNSKSNPPEVLKTEENHSYFYSTIDIEAITYIVNQRKWKLPQLNFNQVQNLIGRLKVNKSPDYFGFSAKHVKFGGNVSVTHIMQYLNVSFQHMEYGVPSEELIGAGSLVHKSGKKSLCDPSSFRKITVCALLGQLKQMAVCDLTLPILKPIKASSQLGFTPGLFVKMANIMVTEKKAWAIAYDLILLIQFLDNTAAFDKTLHPIMEEWRTISGSTFNSSIKMQPLTSSGMVKFLKMSSRKQLEIDKGATQVQMSGKLLGIQ